VSQDTAESREIRDTVEGLELRAAPDGSKSPGTMVGYAAVFDKFSCDIGYFPGEALPGLLREIPRPVGCSGTVQP
jgi:phage head maturation protease